MSFLQCASQSVHLECPSTRTQGLRSVVSFHQLRHDPSVWAILVITLSSLRSPEWHYRCLAEKIPLPSTTPLQHPFAAVLLRCFRLHYSPAILLRCSDYSPAMLLCCFTHCTPQQYPLLFSRQRYSGQLGFSAQQTPCQLGFSAQPTHVDSVNISQ